MTMRLNARMFGFIPGADPLRPRLARAGQAHDPRGADRPRHPERRVPVHQLADALRQPRGGEGAEGLRHRGAARSRPTRRSCGTTGSATSIPISSSTARLAGRVKDKVVVVTGASSGIGKATALKLAEAGAKVILVARGEEKLRRDASRKSRPPAARRWIYTCDVSDLASCDALVARVLKEHGGCDYLVNNAGRSIRRGVINSFDRFHDFERTMQLNYFGALRLIMGFLPKMIEQKRGHIINISSIGVLSNAPRFSAYVASKSALDSFVGLRRVGVPRQGHQLHDDQHAAGAHADDRADQDVRERADAVAGAGGRPRRRGDRLQAGAHRDAPRHLRRGLPRRRAAAHADPAQHRVQHVPRLGRGAGQEGAARRSSSSHPSRWRSPQLTQGIHW